MRKLRDSVVKMDMSRSYEEVIPVPAGKKVQKEEVVVDEDHEFFKRYINLNSSSVQPSFSTANSAINEDTSSNSTSRTKEVKDFFNRLMKGQPD